MNLTREENTIPARPREFTEFWGTALTHFEHTQHEELLETALAAGKMLAEGQIDTALFIIHQAKEALATERACCIQGGETGSTQVVSMIASDLYPTDLTEIAKAVVKAKYPDTKFIKT